MYLEDIPYTTEKISLTANPDFGYKQQFSFRPATRQVSLELPVDGKQTLENPFLVDRLAVRGFRGGGRASQAVRAQVRRGQEQGAHHQGHDQEGQRRILKVMKDFSAYVCEKFYCYGIM